MKKRKSYGRKIKRSRINLYPKRKTKAQKILGTIFLIILILGIVFLGYCLGKPLLEYIEKNRNNPDAPVWTPPVQTDETDVPDDTEPFTAETSVPESETQTTVPAEEPVLSGNVYAVSVPTSALSNAASLTAFAAKSVSEGYTAAVVQLKDSAGNIRYSSDLEVLRDAENVTGTLKAEEIAKILKDKGIIPIASLSVLKDNAGCALNPDMSFKITDEADMSWLDYKEGSPIRWANPENEATALYNKAVADELKAAGFSEIILFNVIFPDFQDYDREYIAAKYFAADRYKLLNSVVWDGAAIEVNAEDVILGNLSETAEVLKNKAALTDNKIIVKINRSAFTGADGYPADAAALLEDVMARISAKNAGLTLVPMVSASEFTPSELSAMKEAAEKLGYKDFYIV